MNWIAFYFDRTFRKARVQNTDKKRILIIIRRWQTIPS
jgi:hypothetical protein